ncbi:MAG TPA: prepilin-type N-terminal cleavage/methylation domain-containing protein [Polyangiaceae bacterium]|jgi:type IV pilus assembly protein PilA|nr:prepilin-type N-terminal cleavage/methylation domain-containing protein [Polyangiaceae bacterium]
MAQALHKGRLVVKRHLRGFTLVEMMIVVVIVGVLATLAVVGYRKLVNSSHVSEATSMVQNIRLAQEAYHSETQQYANISKGFPTGSSASSSMFYPADPKYGIQTAWGAACSSVCNSNMDWSMLPLHVDAPVLFGYATVAGPANSNPTVTTLTVNGNTVTLPKPSTTDWYLIGAEADLDGDPKTVTDVFGTSWTNQIWVSNEGL